MRKIGEIFRVFRESRGFKLKDMENAGISTSQISRFEKGESDLTITKFISALDCINLSIEEIIYAVHDFKQDDLTELLKEIKKCYLENDSAHLQKILIRELEKPKDNFSKMNTILLKIKLQELTKKVWYNEEDIATLIDYLFSVEYWGYYEIQLFGNTMEVFNHKTFNTLTREMIHRSNFYKEISTHKRLISSLTLNAYIICIERNEIFDAYYFEKVIKNFYFDESEIYERLIFKYANAYCDFKVNKSTSSILEMKKVIGFMKSVECTQLAEQYEQHLDKIISNIH
ncbi:Rgg/GadR/MutR family transcriptional regulator [Streptococcus gallolyticus]|uniref:Rgg/GadR/MutR family transcriptional regulator n=1 Tax=Streptococcus gallolyticus TaxID=315405 RepID=UPI0022840431|nr:Rgg/GadR/MutR family transcriptional regulator [Streptococcus gallolyticus]MCY7191597.1 Rgg/GadR/MutR family transcriptional regulator [Streptococcus gallolyticus subsp. gallolyticus]